jgi:hypothetical protein
MIGTTAALTPNGPIFIPVNLQARHVVGVGLSIRP